MKVLAGLYLIFLASGNIGHAMPSPIATCRYSQEAIDIPGPIPFNKLALTFDDGPNPDTTPRVLDVLRKYNIKATFFLIGENMVGNESLVKRILRDGHAIGNHTFTHPHLGELNAGQIRREILKTERLLKHFHLTGARLTRFPYGESSCTAEKIAESRHYNIVGWHADSCDWSFQDGLPDGQCIGDENLRDRFRNDYEGWLDFQLAGPRGGVVLMHDSQPFTADHVEGLIQHWISEGYSFIELQGGEFPELLQDETPWSRDRKATNMATKQQIESKTTTLFPVAHPWVQSSTKNVR